MNECQFCSYSVNRSKISERRLNNLLINVYAMSASLSVCLYVCLSVRLRSEFVHILINRLRRAWSLKNRKQPKKDYISIERFCLTKHLSVSIRMRTWKHADSGQWFPSIVRISVENFYRYRIWLGHVDCLTKPDCVTSFANVITHKVKYSVRK